ncbi:MAG TPA: DUF1549 and DUF1553 domain-containing protein [Verrucomicrobiales bacterium]|nr:DUF1549 and DUF1553 domain-containing protein [Verrucomicrobiales bacterium]
MRRGSVLRQGAARSAAAGLWVLLGVAVVPAISSDEAPVTEEDRGHWAFRPLAGVEVPAAADPAAAGNPVDRFLLARLAEEGLSFAPEADRATLIRRVSFDLTGLPPGWAEVRAFVEDRGPDAYERLVDRLLGSPEYGRRWAQHWLDLARFAESDGFEYDHEREEAWRYRDWVIEAFNADMPYDDFVRRQLAGDELGAGDPSSAVATGFLMAGPDMVDINLVEERRHGFLNEMTSTVGAVYLGLTLGCAQCHDHKSDPVSIHDFYRFQSFFANTVVKPQKQKQLPPVAREPGPLPSPSRVMVRGDFRRPAEEVDPAVPRVLDVLGGGLVVPAPRQDAVSSGRRSALARWMTRPDNALALRVMVNRLWQHHFLVPLVETPNDFGIGGSLPSHPELLEWLAAELPRREWSLKEMHRLLATSAGYQQASRGRGAAWEAALSRDPGNRLLSRMHRRRLSGEAIRDAMLAASGRLNRRIGGRSFKPPLPEEVTATLLKDQWKVSEDPAEFERRSVYLFVRRNLRYPMFDVFDRPDPNLVCGRRDVSTTAPQALTLMNSDLSRDLSESLARRVMAEGGQAKENWIGLVYGEVLGRAPSAGEMEAALGFLRGQSEIAADDGHEEPEKAALTDLCLAVFNSNEAVYVD